MLAIKLTVVLFFIINFVLSIMLYHFRARKQRCHWLQAHYFKKKKHNKWRTQTQFWIIVLKVYGSFIIQPPTNVSVTISFHILMGLTPLQLNVLGKKHLFLTVTLWYTQMHMDNYSSATLQCCLWKLNSKTPSFCPIYA